MEASAWYNHFLGSLDGSRAGKGKNIYEMSSTDWTHHIEKIFKKMEDKRLLNQPVLCRNKSKNQESGEYLSIDAMFFNCKEDPIAKWPHSLPTIVIEHENSINMEKIKFCLWKLCCIRSELRVLIYYQEEDEINRSITELREYLDKNNLLRKDDSLLLIIGNYSSDREKRKCSWDEYYSGYEWKGKQFDQIRAAI